MSADRVREARREAMAPFAFDTWPHCEPWQRAGVPTLWDLIELQRWSAGAELQLRLEIDRRFDAVLDAIRASSWPGID